MNMSNLDEPIIPTHKQVMDGYEALSVRQYACIKMGVAETGCAELDAIIEKGNKQRLAGLAMQGLLSASLGEFPRQKSLTIIAEESIIAANVIFKAVKS